MEDLLTAGASPRPPSSRADWLSWTQHHASMQQEEAFHQQLGQAGLPSVQRPLPGTLEKLRRLLPNLRECQCMGGRVCYRSCDPFRLDAEAAGLLAGLGVRTILDLRWGHERLEQPDAAMYDFFDVAQWTPANAALGDGRFVYQVDFLASPQAELRRFLGRDAPSVALKDADVGAFVAPVSRQRPDAQLATEFVDSFASALGAIFRVLAEPGRYPVLLACPDGLLRCGIVCALLQMLTCEPDEFIVDQHAVVQTELDEFHEVPPDLAAERRAAACETIRQLLRHVRLQYHTVESCLLHCQVTLQQIRQLKTL